MAERGRAPGTGEGGRRPKAGSQRRPGAASATEAGSGKEVVGTGSAGEHPVCTVAFCPICMMVTTIGDLRPELVEHLLAAGRELLLAARAVIDARLQTMEEEEPASGLKRIDIE